MKAPINAALLLGALAALASGFDTRADLLPDAVEVPIATRHFQHNERFNNSTPGIVVQWDAPLVFAGSRTVSANLGAFKNSNGDPTVYAGLHAEWRISGPLFAGGGLGLNKHYSLTLHLITDEKRCKRQPAGLHVTSCALVLGIRGAW